MALDRFRLRLADLIFPGQPSDWAQQLPEWSRRVVDEMNQLPMFSIFSTTDEPGLSNITAITGMIGVDVGSSNTTHLWIGDSDGTTGWRGIG